MMATSSSLKREVNDFVLKDSRAFKQPADFTIRTCLSITSGTFKS